MPDREPQGRPSARLQEVAARLEREWARAADVLEALARTSTALGRHDVARRLRARAPRARLQSTQARWTAMRSRGAPAVEPPPGPPAGRAVPGPLP